MGLENIMIIANLLVISLLGINLKTYILLKKECKLNISKKIKINNYNFKEYDYIDISKTLLKYEKCVLKFIKVIIKNFKEEDLILFYNNINTLKIKENKLILKHGIEGTYIGNENIIEVIDDFEESIYHELFHMASNRFFNKIDYCGFAELSQEFRIGVGLNEGYTELLTNRYFPQRYKSNSYDNEMKYVSFLEKNNRYRKNAKFIFKCKFKWFNRRITKIY